MREFLTSTSYFAASALLIVGIRNLTSVNSARRGLRQAASGLLIAVAGACIDARIVDVRWIVGGIAIGASIGYLMGASSRIAGPPRRIAHVLGLGALAALLVGTADYHTAIAAGEFISRATMAAMGLQVLLGAIAVSGAIVAASRAHAPAASSGAAFGKLAFVSGPLAAFALGLLAYLIIYPATPWVFDTMIGLAISCGILFVMPVGSADLPVVIALLTACAGFANCAMGFATDNAMLIVAGALVGSSAITLATHAGRAPSSSATIG